MANLFDFIFLLLGILVGFKVGFIVYEYLFTTYARKTKKFEKEMDLALYSDHIATERYGTGVSILLEDTLQIENDYPEKACIQIFDFFFSLRELNVNFVYLKPIGCNKILYKSACADEGRVVRGNVYLRELH